MSVENSQCARNVNVRQIIMLREWCHIFKTCSGFSSDIKAELIGLNVEINNVKQNLNILHLNENENHESETGNLNSLTNKPRKKAVSYEVARNCMELIICFLKKSKMNNVINNKLLFVLRGKLETFSLADTSWPVPRC